MIDLIKIYIPTSIFNFIYLNFSRMNLFGSGKQIVLCWNDIKLFNFFYQKAFNIKWKKFPRVKVLEKLLKHCGQNMNT